MLRKPFKLFSLLRVFSSSIVSGIFEVVQVTSVAFVFVEVFAAVTQLSVYLLLSKSFQTFLGCSSCFMSSVIVLCSLGCFTSS